MAPRPHDLHDLQVAEAALLGLLTVSWRGGALLGVALGVLAGGCPASGLAVWDFSFWGGGGGKCINTV